MLSSFALGASDCYVMFDHVFTHKGDRQLWEDWSFDGRRQVNPAMPRDWIATSIFDTGIYVFRVEVLHMERAWTNPPHVQFGWWNFPRGEDTSIRHIASPPLLLTHLEPPAPGKPWVYEYVGRVRALDVTFMYYGAGPKAELDGRVTDWNWKTAFGPTTVSTLFNPRENAFDADNDGKISEAEYPNVEFRAILSIYLPGAAEYPGLSTHLSAFSPWRGKQPKR